MAKSKTRKMLERCVLKPNYKEPDSICTGTTTIYWTSWNSTDTTDDNWHYFNGTV